MATLGSAINKTRARERKREGECKERKRQHVKQQMHDVGMDESTAHNSINPLTAVNAERVQYQLGVNIVAVKRPYRSKYSKSKYEGGYRGRLQIFHYFKSSLVSVTILPTG